MTAKSPHALGSVFSFEIAVFLFCVAANGIAGGGPSIMLLFSVASFIGFCFIFPKRWVDLRPKDRELLSICLFVIIVSAAAWILEGLNYLVD